MSPEHQNAPAEASALRHAVQPCHRVEVVGIAFVGGTFKRLVEVARAHVIHHNPRGLHAAQLQFHFQNDAREPHPADRGVKEVGVLLTRATHGFTTLGSSKVNDRTKLPREPSWWWFLPCTSHATHAPHRAELGAGRHWQKPATRQESGDDVRQRNATLAPQQPRFLCQRRGSGQGVP
jgi:hypothetical protein